MSNNALANVNEVAFTLECKYLSNNDQSFQYKLEQNGDKLKLGVLEPASSHQELIDELEKKVADIKYNEINEKKVMIKIEQAKQGANNFIQWLAAGATRVPRLPESFTKDFWEQPLNIVQNLVGWTDTPAKFVTFLTEQSTKGATTMCNKPFVGDTLKHNGNPSDTLVVVTDGTDQHVLGISLKATFSTGELTIFNGGVCATLSCVIKGEDVSKKKTRCAQGPNKTSGDNKVIWTEVDEDTNAYKEFLKVMRSKHGLLKMSQWNELKKEFEPDKIISLSIVRDNLMNRMKNEWGLVQNGSKFEANVDHDKALKIVGGIFQFTHDNISDNCTTVPYVKLTGYLKTSNSGTYFKKNTKVQILEKAGKGDIFSEIKPPDLTHYVPKESAVIPIKIEKAGGVSIKLTIGDTQPFNVRVKCADRPPSSIKIDISPVQVPKPKKTKKTKTKAKTKAKAKTKVKMGGGVLDSVDILTEPGLNIIDKFVDWVYTNINGAEEQDGFAEDDNIIQLQNIWQDLTCEKPQVKITDIEQEFRHEADDVWDDVDSDPSIGQQAGKHMEWGVLGVALERIDERLDFSNVFTIICEEIGKKISLVSFVRGVRAERAVTRACHRGLYDEISSLYNLWEALNCDNEKIRTSFDDFFRLSNCTTSEYMLGADAGLHVAEGKKGGNKRKHSKGRRRSSKKKTRSKRRLNKKRTSVRRCKKGKITRKK